MELALPDNLIEVLKTQQIAFSVIRGHKDISDFQHIEIEVKECELKLLAVESSHESLCKIISLSSKAIA